MERGKRPHPTRGPAPYVGSGPMPRRDFVALATSSLAVPWGQGTAPSRALRLVAGFAAEPPRQFRLAYLSDAHVAFGNGARRTLAALVRAIEEINASVPQPDLVVFGGDLTQSGSAQDLTRAAATLAQVRAPVAMVAGEHDWYGAGRARWQALFGPPEYAFALHGVTFVALLSVRLPPSWPGHGLAPNLRLEAMAGRRGGAAPPFEVGEAGRAFLAATLAPLPNERPLVILCHAPPSFLGGPRAPATADGEAVLELLGRFADVTVVHGHTHQVLHQRVGNVTAFGMAATAWPWPHAPGPLPAPTLALHAAHPHGGLVGCGHGRLEKVASGPVTKAYTLWGHGVVQIGARR